MSLTTARRRAKLTGACKMTNTEIRDLFDSNPNLTVAHIARRTGKSTAQIVKILMEKN